VCDLVNKMAVRQNGLSLHTFQHLVQKAPSPQLSLSVIMKPTTHILN
jgi:hypothetical protein